MAKKLVKLSDIDRNEWLGWRRKGIGGSDAATVVGLNPYSSLYESGTVCRRQILRSNWEKGSKTAVYVSAQQIPVYNRKY